MPIVYCPRCQKAHTVARFTTDFVCDCSENIEAGSAVTRESIVVIGDWEDYTGSGIVNNALQAGKVNTEQGTRADHESNIHIDEKNLKGDNKSTHRLRKHQEYFKIIKNK